MKVSKNAVAIIKLNSYIPACSRAQSMTSSTIKSTTTFSCFLIAAKMRTAKAIKRAKLCYSSAKKATIPMGIAKQTLRKINPIMSIFDIQKCILKSFLTAQ
jgi:response regulator of citrate/malate metabolism